MLKKEVVLAHVLTELERECGTLRRAALEAHQSATHAEAKPENKYDTRGLEASYLAQGQARRVGILEKQIQELRSPGSGHKQVLLEARCGEELLYFMLLPFAGGLSLQIETFQVQVISESSPLGQLLRHKEIHDTFAFKGKEYLLEEKG